MSTVGRRLADLEAEVERLREALLYAHEWADSGSDNHAGLWYVTRCALDDDITLDELRQNRQDIADWVEKRAVSREDQPAPVGDRYADLFPSDCAHRWHPDDGSCEWCGASREDQQ